ncbi:MAG: glycerophosphodiester phosphodiesterase [Acidimicrobiales bacterium]
MVYRLSQRPQLVAHMGYSAREPANTVRSTLAAVEAGADMVEMDVCMTSDGHMVAIHGPDLERSTSGAGAVAESTLDYITSLDVKFRGELVPGVKVPTLTEMVEATPDAAFNFDLKTARARRPIVDFIVANRLVDRAVVSGVTAWGVGVVRRADPSVSVLVNLDRVDRALAATKAGRYWLPLRYRWLLSRPGVTALNINHRWVSRGLVDAVHALGAEVWAFTVDDQKRVDQLIEKGVDSLTTNVPGELMLAPAVAN